MSGGNMNGGNMNVALAGVTWAPRPLGIEGDRERLSYIEGEVPLSPVP